ncbi:MAG TPA: hypothetical protein PKV24_19900, partial [Cyclobacteriaceae bacterium]|nr:hypothetical protein [Cyclobacteriaceae bacterium]
MNVRKTVRQLLIEIANSSNASRLSKIIAYYYPNLPAKINSRYEKIFEYYKTAPTNLSFEEISHEEQAIL